MENHQLNSKAFGNSCKQCKEREYLPIKDHKYVQQKDEQPFTRKLLLSTEIMDLILILLNSCLQLVYDFREQITLRCKISLNNSIDAYNSVGHSLIKPTSYNLKTTHILIFKPHRTGLNWFAKAKAQQK